MASIKWYLIEDVNPQPWAIGPLGLGRRNGGMYPYVGPNSQLTTFQKAIRDELGDFDILPFDGDVELDFFFWRKIESYKTVKRTQVSHEADTTNLQKALEDALQGILFANDRSVKRIRSTVVEQGRSVQPKVVIKASPWIGFNPDEIPSSIWSAIDRQPTLSIVDPNAWTFYSEDVF